MGSWGRADQPLTSQHSPPYSEWLLCLSLVEVTFLCIEVYLHNTKAAVLELCLTLMCFTTWVCTKVYGCCTAQVDWELGAFPSRTQRQKPQPQRASIRNTPQMGSAGSPICPIPFSKTHLPVAWLSVGKHIPGWSLYHKFGTEALELLVHSSV